MAVFLLEKNQFINAALIFHVTVKYRLQFVPAWTSLKFLSYVYGLIVTQNITIVFHRVENHCRKR